MPTLVEELSNSKWDSVRLCSVRVLCEDQYALTGCHGFYWRGRPEGSKLEHGSKVSNSQTLTRNMVKFLSINELVAPPNHDVNDRYKVKLIPVYVPATK